MMPFAEARGLLTDEDVFRSIMRIFLDTNVIASATATVDFVRIFRTVIASHDLIVSDHLIEEVRRILGDTAPHRV